MRARACQRPCPARPRLRSGRCCLGGPPRNRTLLFIWAASTRGRAAMARRTTRRARGGFFHARLVAVAPLLAEITRRGRPTARVDATAARRHTRPADAMIRVSPSPFLSRGVPRPTQRPFRHPCGGFRRPFPPRSGEMARNSEKSEMGLSRPPFPPSAESARPAEIRRDYLQILKMAGAELGPRERDERGVETPLPRDDARRRSLRARRIPPTRPNRSTDRRMNYFDRARARAISRRAEAFCDANYTPRISSRKLLRGA